MQGPENKISACITGGKYLIDLSLLQLWLINLFLSFGYLYVSEKIRRKDCRGVTNIKKSIEAAMVY